MRPKPTAWVAPPTCPFSWMLQWYLPLRDGLKLEGTKTRAKIISACFCLAFVGDTKKPLESILHWYLLRSWLGATSLYQEKIRKDTKNGFWWVGKIWPLHSLVRHGHSLSVLRMITTCPTLSLLLDIVRPRFPVHFVTFGDATCQANSTVSLFRVVILTRSFPPSPQECQVHKAAISSCSIAAKSCSACCISSM